MYSKVRKIFSAQAEHSVDGRNYKGNTLSQYL